MGQQPSTNGFCHHETIWRVKTSKKQETSRFVNIEIRSVHGSNVQKSVWHQTRRPFSSKKQNYNFIVDHLYWYENLINFFIILDTLPVLICKFETIKLIFSSIQIALKITLEITLPVRILCRLHWECFFQWKVFFGSCIIFQLELDDNLFKKFSFTNILFIQCFPFQLIKDSYNFSIAFQLINFSFTFNFSFSHYRTSNVITNITSWNWKY